MEVSVVTLPAAEPALRDAARSQDPEAPPSGLFAAALEHARAPAESPPHRDSARVETTEPPDTSTESAEAPEDVEDVEQADDEGLQAALAALLSSPQGQQSTATDASAEGNASEASATAALQEASAEQSAQKSSQTTQATGQPQVAAASEETQEALLNVVATSDAEGAGERASPDVTASQAAFELLEESASDGTGLLRVDGSEGHAKRASDVLKDLDAPAQAASNGASKSGLVVARFYGDVEQSAQTPDATPAVAAPDRATMQTLAEDAVKGVRYLVTHDEKVITVRLVPESLGELHIEITAVKNVVNVRLLSGNAEVRHVLDGQLNDLRASLAREGIVAERVVVAPGMTAHAGFADTPNRPKDPDAAKGRSPDQTGRITRVETSVTRSRPAGHQGLLNVFV